jgi:adenylosuccinate synthase
MMEKHTMIAQQMLVRKGWLQDEGAYVLVDGQYGSTGKGLAASFLAELFPNTVDRVTTNAGPNSGHTSYFGDEKIVLKQLPTFSVIAARSGEQIPTYINAGAIIVPEILHREVNEYKVLVTIHTNAAVVNDETKSLDQLQSLRIGSTGQGTGEALAAKVRRQENVIARNSAELFTLPKYDYTFGQHGITFVEVSQGFSLGINQPFYPYCTSRECTVSQALLDAAIHPSFYRDSMMVVRTYPIRVAGNSGDCYSDQTETSWEELGFEAEQTTVTKKVRRVFTWSTIQFQDAVRHNRPGHIFLNFCNYLEDKGIDVRQFVQSNVIEPYVKVMGVRPKTVLLGYGPNNSDVRLFE